MIAMTEHLKTNNLTMTIANSINKKVALNSFCMFSWQTKILHTSQKQNVTRLIQLLPKTLRQHHLENCKTD